MRTTPVLICEEREMEVDDEEQKEQVSLRQQNAEWEEAARRLAEQDQQLEASGTPVKVDEITYTLTEYTKRELNEDDVALHADNEEYDGKDDEEDEEEEEESACPSRRQRSPAAASRSAAIPLLDSQSSQEHLYAQGPFCKMKRNRTKLNTSEPNPSPLNSDSAAPLSALPASYPPSNCSLGSARCALRTFLSSCVCAYNSNSARSVTTDCATLSSLTARYLSSTSSSPMPLSARARCCVA